MTPDEVGKLSDQDYHLAMVAAVTSKPASIEDFKSLYNRRRPQGGPGLLFRNDGAAQRGPIAGNQNAAPGSVKQNQLQPKLAPNARPPHQGVKSRPFVPRWVCAHCSTEAHHYFTWQKHDHSVAVACHACKKPRKEAPASSSKAMAAVSAENAPDMQDVLREQTQTFMAAMREELQATNQVPVREAAFADMREMEGNGFELGMGMAAMDVETKNDAILEAGSKATINDEVLTREEKLQAQADAAGDERTVGTWEATEK